MISNLPFKLQKYITKIIVLFVYLPLARLSLILDLFGRMLKTFHYLITEKVVFTPCK